MLVESCPYASMWALSARQFSVLRAVRGGVFAYVVLVCDYEVPLSPPLQLIDVVARDRHVNASIGCLAIDERSFCYQDA